MHDDALGSPGLLSDRWTLGRRRFLLESRASEANEEPANNRRGDASQSYVCAGSEIKLISSTRGETSYLLKVCIERYGAAKRQ